MIKFKSKCVVCNKPVWIGKHGARNFWRVHCKEHETWPYRKEDMYQPEEES